MASYNATKPATVVDGEPASGIEHLGGPLENPHTPSIVIAQLVGSDRAIANGIEASGAFELCRRLLATGEDPTAELVCLRGGIVALRVKTIGRGAKLTVRETANDGPRVVRWKPFQHRDVSSPMHQKQEPVAA